MANIAIFGSGAWGTALANVLLENGHTIAIWGIDEKEINDLNNQKNTNYYGERKLIKKPNIASTNIDEVLSINPTFIIIAVPSIFIVKTLQLFVDKLKNKCYFINVSKGLDPETNGTWSSTIKHLTKNKIKELITMIGPSFAVEVFNDQPTMINTVSSSIASARIVSLLFNNHHFKCVETKDEIGAELIGALKNVMAIAMGVAYALHTSINTRAAMLAQATKEIAKLVTFYKGRLETITQFCGIGDIYLTCTDEKSRNFSFGKSIAEIGLAKTLQLNKKTVEGYLSTKIIYQVIKNKQIISPVFEEIYYVLFNNADPKSFVKNIMKRIIE